MGEAAIGPYRIMADRTCEWGACKKVPHFGKEGGAPVYCGLHKSDNHVDVRKKK